MKFFVSFTTLVAVAVAGPNFPAPAGPTLIVGPSPAGPSPIVSPNPIAVGPAIDNFHEVNPIAVGPAIVDVPVPPSPLVIGEIPAGSPTPLVQIIVKTNDQESSVVVPGALEPVVSGVSVATPVAPNPIYVGVPVSPVSVSNPIAVSPVAVGAPAVVSPVCVAAPVVPAPAVSLPETLN